MLMQQEIPLGIGLSFHANVSFPFTKSTWLLIIVWKTVCKMRSNTATGFLEIMHYKSNRTSKK